MSINVFGSLGKTIAVSKKYIDSKFNTLVNNLKLKSDKNVSADIDMNNHSILNVKAPVDFNHVVNKRYVDEQDKLNRDQLNTVDENSKFRVSIFGDSMLGDLDVNHYTLANLKYPTNSLDAVNQKYVQLSIYGVTVDIGKLIQVATAISDIFQKYPEDNIRNYKDDFSTSLQNVKLLVNAYEESTEFHKTNIFADLSSNSFINGLNFLIVTVIENLPVNIFQELKRVLVGENLSQTPIQPGVLKRDRYFITKRVKVIDPTGSDDRLQLLICKNLLLIDLGFPY